MGLRQLKKQKTKKNISDIATVMFMERGFHSVTTAEIAAKAEVSLPTLFAYFPSKESLVFDEDAETEAKMVNAVLGRKKGQSILDALLEEGYRNLNELKAIERKNFRRFIALIQGTPELNSYSQLMWLRHEKALGAAIRKEARTKLSSLEAESIARFVLDSFHRSVGTSNPKAVLKVLFQLIKKGWSEN